MELTKDTVIKYTLEDKNGEVVTGTFTLEQVEGSDFYNAFKESLRDLEDFDVDSSEIIKREII